MIVERIARGLSVIGDPMPAPGRPGTLSGPSPTSLGSIPLVPSLGRNRDATYRMIYLTNPWVYAAVNMLARGIARTPLHVFEWVAVNGKPRKRRVRGDIPVAVSPNPSGAALDGLLSGPGGQLSRFARWYGTTADRLIYGSGLWEIERRGRAGEPVELRRLRWRTVQHVEESDDGEILFYEVGPAHGFGRPRRLAPDEVIHFGRGLDPEGPGGLSPLESCRYTLALHEAIMRSLVAWFGNAMQGSGHIEVDKLTPEKAREIRQMILEAYGSPENAGKVLVTSGKWAPRSETPEHAAVGELLRHSREEVAAAYQIPPPVLGILENAIKSNVKELREQYVRDSLGSWAPEFEDDLHAQLLPRAPAWTGLFTRFQLAEQLRPDLEARSRVYNEMKHVLTIDRMRELEDEEPLDIPGVSDVPWVDSGAMPITRAADPSAPRPPPATSADSLNGHHDHVPEVTT